MSEEAGYSETDHIVVQEKSKWFAAFVNFIIPGLGYFYLGRETDAFDVGSKGWGVVGVWILSLLTAILIIGGLIYIVLMIYVIWDCFTLTEETQVDAKLAASGI